MSRGEWVTLPGRNGNRTPCMLRRSAIIGYGEVTNNGRPTGTIWVQVAGAQAHADCDISLAEFEALLFGAAPAEDDAYTRAAVRYAEASVALNDAEMKLTRAVDRKQHDTDDLRSDVCSAGYAHDDAEDAFTALYREKHGG